MPSQSVDTWDHCTLSVASSCSLANTKGNAILGATVRAGGQGGLCSMGLGHCDDINFPKVHSENASSQKVLLSQHDVRGPVPSTTAHQEQLPTVED